MSQPGSIWSIEGITAAKLANGDNEVAIADSVVPGVDFPIFYSITFENVPPGDYELILFAGSNAVAGASVTVTTNGWAERTSSVDDSIAEILSRISGGAITWQSPVLQTGELSGPIIVGDDYIAEVGRTFDWFVDPLPIASNLATCFFGGKSPSKPPGWIVQGNVSETMLGDQQKWRLRFELPRSITSLLKPGLYNWSAEVRGPTSHVTRVLGSVNVVPKQTV